MKSAILRYRPDGTIDRREARRVRKLIDKIATGMMESHPGLITGWVSYPEHATVTLPRPADTIPGMTLADLKLRVAIENAARGGE